MRAKVAAVVIAATLSANAAIALTAERVAIAPPESLVAPIRAALESEASLVRDDAGPLAQIWLRRKLSPADGSQAQSPLAKQRVNFLSISPGSLVAVIEFRRPWRDFRDREVATGLYTMRYVVQPWMKEHRGVSEFRDFLVLAPVAGETALDVTPEDAIKTSLAASGRGHPAVVALVPVEGGNPNKELIRRVGDREVLVVTGDLATLGIVLVGHGKLDESVH